MDDAATKEKYESELKRARSDAEYRQSIGRVVLGALDEKGIFRNCLNCSHFIEVMEMCEKHNQRPPARVIARGCSDHSDCIPF